MARAIKKIAGVFVTALLILSTTICIILIGKSAFGGSVSLLGYRLFYVVTGSMEPTIHAGAVTLVHENDTYNVGDIITFKSKEAEIYGEPNTHRIVRIVEDNGKTYYVTKGDANESEDSAMITESDIYGKVVWYSGRMDWFGSILGFIMTPVGFLLVILLPILALTVSQLKDFTKTYKEALVMTAMQSVNTETERDGQNDKLEKE